MNLSLRQQLGSVSRAGSLKLAVLDLVHFQGEGTRARGKLCVERGWLVGPTSLPKCRTGVSESTDKGLA